MADPMHSSVLVYGPSTVCCAATYDDEGSSVVIQNWGGEG